MSAKGRAITAEARGMLGGDGIPLPEHPLSRGEIPAGPDGTVQS